MSRSWSPITERPLKFALVGYGRVAPRHVEAVLQLGPDAARWVAVCDTDEQARERASADLDVPVFADYGEMLEQRQPDVVILATPSGLHPAHAVQASEAGAHVVTEKPMATRWNDGQRMVRAARENRTALFVVKQHRYNPAARALKRAVDDSRFGRLHAIQLNLFWTRPQAYYDMAPWRGTWELDGGALMNQAIHYIDLLQWIAGPVEGVHAFASTLGRRIEVEDTAAVNLRWRCGALGSVTVTMLTPPKNYEGSITMIGERGLVRIGGVACSRIETWQFDESAPQDDELDDARWPEDRIYGDGHGALYENIAAALRGEDADLVDGAEGLKSLEIVVAAYRSAQEGRRISLPLELELCAISN